MLREGARFKVELPGQTSIDLTSDVVALLNRIRRWWARETGKAPVEEWDEDRRQGLKKDFKLILVIYEAL